jgi:dihydrofolate reductase
MTVVRPLLYSINVTLDGCVDHSAVPADDALLQEMLRATQRHATDSIGRADALLFGRVTYQMMEEAWRRETRTIMLPDWTESFPRTINAMKKYVVSSTLSRVDWNAELLSGNLGEAVQKLKQQPGKALFTGGVKLPMALAELGLIDEYEFVVQPRLAGHGPTLFAGLSKYVELKLVDRRELGSGAVLRAEKVAREPATLNPAMGFAPVCGVCTLCTGSARGTGLVTVLRRSPISLCHLGLECERANAAQI